MRAFHAGHNRTSPDLSRVVRGVALGGQDTPLKGGVLSDDQRTHAQLIEAVANRIRKLVPSHRDPEAFHVEKSEIEAELREIARSGLSKAGLTPLLRVLPTSGECGPRRRAGFLDEIDLAPKVRV